ncbi:tyrosine-type recombinase/integrase [Vibrio parahaemolyticus]|nr:tyrosine-type recombinase/integrase [Vibrio parahaemolyticus]HCG9703136.1 tyrosine-type recombinase/integrase [Vibrio parahaemolyticus]
MHFATSFTKSPPINLTLNTPIPICVDYYIEVKAQYHKSYLGTIQYRLARISSYFSSYLIKDLTTSPYARDNVNSFITHRFKSVKAGTVRKDASVLQAMLNWLRRDVGLQIPDIFKQIRLPEDYGVRQFVPTDEEVYEVIGYLPSEELRDICMLLSETACRRNEVLNLCIKDVYLVNRYIQLWDTKNGEDRQVPLSTAAVAILRKRLQYLDGKPSSCRVFSLLPCFVSKSFRKAADKAGLHSFVVHSLRHYRLSKLIQAGHDSILVSKVSGHRDHRALSRYVKLDAEALAKHLFD